jgi:uncharacterized membrane protein YphA (DoxX/SURF4 family)
MNVTLWIVRGPLAFAFIAVGTMKLFAYEKFKARSEKKGPTGITRGLAAFIGVAEVAGGIGIVLPMATNIAPSVSMWAAVGLSSAAVGVRRALGASNRRNSMLRSVIMDGDTQSLLLPNERHQLLPRVTPV